MWSFNKIVLFFSLLISSLCNSQLDKPSVMFVPSKLWMHEQGYTIKQDVQGIEVLSLDYDKALLQNKDLRGVLTMMNGVISNYGYLVKDFEQSLLNYKNDLSLDKSAHFPEVDIRVEISWEVSVNGPRKKVDCSLRAIDSYTEKQIAELSKSSDWIMGSSISTIELLKEAMLSGMDNFSLNLNAFMEDTYRNGREITLQIATSPDWVSDFESVFNGIELELIIEDWVAKNSMNNKYFINSSTQTKMNFNQLRIPLFNANKEPINTRGWLRMLQQDLKSTYGIPCKIENSSNYKYTLIIG